MTTPETVHILCATFNGGPYLVPFLDSVARQRWSQWHLWVHDDGSTDGTAERVAAAAAADARITLVPGAGGRCGVPGAFVHLWRQLPVDAALVMFADQDDVWHPEKISRSVAMLRRSDRDGTVPTLVHTDLAVVDANLQPIAPSFWRFAGLDPRPRPFREVVAHNSVTGNTVLLNAALRHRIGVIDDRAAMHDWWVACVAAAFGQVVVVDEPMVSYRQHGANSVGARARLGSAQRPVWAVLQGAWARRKRVRWDLGAAARQAAALADCYGAHLPPAELEFLRRFAEIPSLPWWPRKQAVWAMGRVPTLGVLRNLGVVLRS